MNKYILLDWDGTLREGATLDAWCSFLYEQNKIGTSYFEERKQLISQYRQAKIDHDTIAHETNQAYLKAVKGLDWDCYQQLAAQFCKKTVPWKEPFVSCLTDWLHTYDVAAIVISGSSIHLIEPLFDTLGIEKGIAFSEEVINGVMTGNAQTEGGHSKQAVVDLLFQEYQACPVLAAGDSESDIPMLDKAQYQIVAGENSSLLERYPKALVVNAQTSESMIIKFLEKIADELNIEKRQKADKKSE